MAERSVVIPDGDQRACLAAVRSLGAAGWRVHVVSSRARSLAGASRFAAFRHAATDPLTDPQAFRADLRDIVADARATLVVPISEAALLAVAERVEDFAPALVPFPDRKTLLLASDKRAMLERASALGIAVPRTVVLEDAGGLATVDVVPADFPLVIKPARSVRPDAAPGRKFVVTYANGADELAAAVRAAHPGAFPLLLQNVVVGPGTGIFLLVDGDRVHGAFAHRRVREKPPSGGVSVYRESVALPPELFEASVRLLRDIGWRGIAMVEYKEDARTGDSKLMEINPRFWGSLQLAIDAGVDFPRLLADWATGAAVGGAGPYGACASRWFWGEVDHLIARAREGARGGPLPTARAAARCLREQVRSRGPRSRLEVLRAHDPKPFLHESLRWFRALL
jgi:predicted ATP-grasp superfamily ATP-dependent carboligase